MEELDLAFTYGSLVLLALMLWAWQWHKEWQQRYKKEKTLLILDANGLLVYRKYSPQTQGEEPLPPPEGATRLRAHLTWKRPGLDEFLERAFAHFRVGVWSSARPENVACVCEYVFGPLWKERLALVRDQTHCTLVPSQDSDKPRFLKTLEEEERKEDVIIVDDSANKIQHNPPECVVVVDPWTPHHQKTDGHHQTLDDVWRLILEKEKK